MKIKLRHRILAFAMALMMVFGLAEGIPTKAENTSPTMSITSLRGGEGNNASTRVYVSYTMSGEYSLPSDVNNTYFKPTDTTSGVWLNDTWIEMVWGIRTISKTSADILWGTGTSYSASDGDILTVKGTFSNVTYGSFVIEEIKFRYAASTKTWEIYDAVPTTDLTEYSFRLDTASSNLNGNGLIYLIHDDATANDIVLSTNYYADSTDTESGVWLNGTKITVPFVKDAAKTYRFGRGSELIKPSAAGDKLKIQGTFTTVDGTSAVKFGTLEYEYTGTAWKEVEEEEVGIIPIDLTEYSFRLDTTSSNLNGNGLIYLIHDDETANDIVLSTNYYADSADNESGVWLNGTKITVPFVKDNAKTYRFGRGSELIRPSAAGDKLKIQGTFTTVDETSAVKFGTLEYEYTGTAWKEVEEGDDDSGTTPTPPTPPTPPVVETVDVKPLGLNASAAPKYNTNRNVWQLYVSTDKDLPGDRWANYFTGLVVEVDGVAASGVIIRKDDWDGMCIDIPAASLPQSITKNAKVVVKAGLASANDYEFNLTADFTLYVNQYGWSTSNYLSATDVTITGINETAYPAFRDDKSAWAFYLTTDKDMPGNRWVDFSNVKVEIDGVATDVRVCKDDWDGMYVQIPSSALPQLITKNTKVVIKAGVGTSGACAINITKDFVIYANQYGFSTSDYMKEIVAEQTNAKLTLDTTLNYGGNENGIYLNTTDNFPVDKTWATRIRAVMYDAGSGIFYNGVKMNSATLCRFADGKVYVSLSAAGIKAKDKDKITIKGLFALGEKGVSYAEANFYYNGQIWGSTYTAPKPETYKKFAVESVNRVSKWNATKQGWDVYLDVNTMLPGEIDNMRFENLTVVVNGKEIPTRVSHSFEHTLFFLIPAEYLPENCGDGIAITLKAGKALAGDRCTGIELTKDFTVYTFRGAVTATKPTTNTTWQNITITSMLRTTAFNAGSKAWIVHVKLKETWTSEDKTIFYQFPLEIDGKTHLVEATQDGEFLYFRIPEVALPSSTKTATISVKAGASAAGNAGYDGIRITEDWEAYLFNGVISEKKFTEIVRTETNIVGLQNVTERDTQYNVYIRLNREIPGTAWYEQYEDFVYYYNGKKITTRANKNTSSNNKFLYFAVSKDAIGTPKEGDIITIKPETVTTCGGYQIAIMNEFMLMYSDGIWSQYMETNVTAPDVSGSLWETLRFDSAYIPTTEDGSVLFAGSDSYNMVSSSNDLKDYTLKFRIKKSLDDEETPPFRVIMRGTAISETEPMTASLLNGYVITFSPSKVTDAETGEVHYGSWLNLWKNGENASLMDQYRISYVYDDTEHPFYANDTYYDFEISVYNVTDTCVCITIKVNDKLVMRYYDEAGSDPFDPAINSGTFAVQAICPVTIQDEIAELSAVIAESDKCQVGDNVRVAATYPSVIEGAEFTVDSKNATVKDGIFKAEKAGTYTVSCTYNGKELEPKVIEVVEGETQDVASEGTFPMIPVIVIAIVVVVAGVVGFFFVKKKKGVKKEEA